MNEEKEPDRQGKYGIEAILGEGTNNQGPSLTRDRNKTTKPVAFMERENDLLGIGSEKQPATRTGRALQTLQRRLGFDSKHNRQLMKHFKEEREIKVCFFTKFSNCQNEQGMG